jgi:hypothetical protein
MNQILAAAILVGMTGCSYTQPHVSNIPPAGKNSSEEGSNPNNNVITIK